MAAGFAQYRTLVLKGAMERFLEEQLEIDRLHQRVIVTMGVIDTDEKMIDFRYEIIDRPTDEGVLYS